MTRTVDDPRQRGLTQLHLAALLLSSAVVAGKLIGATMTAYQKIGLRCLLATPLLLVFAALSGRRPLQVRRGDLGRVLACGVLMGVHWTLFFLSAQVSTAAVAQLLVFTSPAMMALAEPLLGRHRLNRRTLVHACVVALGMSLPFWGDAGRQGPLGNLSLGVLLGLGAAAAFAARNLMAGDLVRRYDAVTLMGWQVFIVGVGWIPALFAAPITAGPREWTWMLVLATGATAVGHTMFIVGLKRFSAATASLVVAMQPVYAAVYAYFLLGERVTPGLVLGGAIVMGAVLVETRAAALTSSPAPETAPLGSSAPR